MFFFFWLTGCHADNLWHDQKCHKLNLLTNKMHFSHFVRITHKIHTKKTEQSLPKCLENNLNSNSFSRMLLLKMANNFATQLHGCHMPFCVVCKFFEETMALIWSYDNLIMMRNTLKGWQTIAKNSRKWNARVFVFFNGDWLESAIKEPIALTTKLDEYRL